MRIVFSEYASMELKDGVIFYETHFPGLGKVFKTEVKKAVQRIAEYPTAWSTETKQIRKYLLHKFPYKLLYSIEDDHIVIIAVAHQHRRPNYWVERGVE